MIELKPCPFCGSEPEIETYGDFHEGPMFHVRCPEAMCAVRPAVSCGSEASVGEAWNRRAPERREADPSRIEYSPHTRPHKRFDGADATSERTAWAALPDRTRRIIGTLVYYESGRVRLETCNARFTFPDAASAEAVTGAFARAIH